MREYAQDYIDTTSLTEPEVDIKIDFIQLWNTPGYEDVVQAEQVSLCDTVHVYISKLGIEASSKVTETEYDSLLERYNSITLSNSTVSSRNSSLTSSLNSIRNTATAAYDTAVRVETAVGEQMGGISASIIYDGALFAALFGLHYKNETDSKGNTTRYAFNAATLKQSTVAWKNSPAGFFVSTDGGKTWGYGWESDDSAVKTAILLEQTLKELDDRYKKAAELSEEFSLTLKVERAAINNGKIATYTFAAFLKAVRDGIRNLFIDEAGCFGFESDDGLGLSDRSESSSVEKLCREIVEGSITEDGYFAFETKCDLG